MVEEKHNLGENCPKGKKKVLASRIIEAAMVMIWLTGCAAVGPNYIPPEPKAPEQWNARLGGGLNSESGDPQRLAKWWTTLDDPTLTSLIERAIKSNLDLKKAQARVQEARARRGISNAEQFPTIDATGTATSRRSSENNGSGRRSESYAIGFDASWELDLFGGIRRSREAAQADLEANQEDLRDSLVTLVGDVALNYVDARTLQERIGLAEKNLEVQAETYELAAARYKAGLTTALDVDQAKYNMESTRSQIPGLRTNLEAAKNRLAVLLGTHPGTIDGDLAESKPVPVTPLEIAVGVPAEALRRRPDVRRAERELAAQTARVGVATADLYPKFSLSGSIGLEALSLGDLFSSGSRMDSSGAGFSWNIFDAGAIRKNIEVQNALQEQALIAYEATILTALEDTENALTAYAEEQMRRQALLEATQAAEQAVSLALAQYASGLVDFQEVLEVQRSLLSFQGQLAESNGSVTSNLIRLYKALGGGWASLTPAAYKASGEERVFRHGFSHCVGENPQKERGLGHHLAGGKVWDSLGH